MSGSSGWCWARRRAGWATAGSSWWPARRGYRARRCRRGRLSWRQAVSRWRGGSAGRAAGEPVISVDAKKKELVGAYASKGRSWRPKGDPQRVNVHDFIDKQLGKAVPYGVYDIGADTGWVAVGQ